MQMAWFIVAAEYTMHHWVSLPNSQFFYHQNICSHHSLSTVYIVKCFMLALIPPWQQYDSSSGSQLPGIILNHTYATVLHAGDMVENLMLLLICHPYQTFEHMTQFLVNEPLLSLPLYTDIDVSRQSWQSTLQHIHIHVLSMNHHSSKAETPHFMDFQNFVMNVVSSYWLDRWIVESLCE